MGRSCGRLWTLRSGPFGHGFRYFSLLPLGHEDRLHFIVTFARKPGEGFKFNSVDDWEPELAGQPWGPSVSEEELEEYTQADGSMLLMVHGLGLSAENGQQDAALSEASTSPPTKRRLWD